MRRETPERSAETSKPAIYRTLPAAARDIDRPDKPAPRLDLVVARRNTLSATVTDGAITHYARHTTGDITVDLDAPAVIHPDDDAEPVIESRTGMLMTSVSGDGGHDTPVLALVDTDTTYRRVPLYDVVTDVIRLDETPAPEAEVDDEVSAE